MNRALIPVVGLLLLSVAACHKPTPPPQGPLPVTFASVVQQDVSEMQTWVGLLNGYQNADIRPQITGYLMTQNYKEGSYVKRGTVLFTIDQRPFQAALAQAQADFAQATAKAQLQQSTLVRQEQLYQTKVISQQQYDTSYQDTQAAMAAAAAAQAAVDTAKINLNYCTIVAPLDGIVGTAQAQIGDLVGPGGTASTLTQMSQVDPIKMVFSITEEDYLKSSALIDALQKRTPAEYKSLISLTLADGTTYPDKGRFDFVNRQVNSATGSIQITALFPNPNNLLRPGLFGRVTAPIRQIKDAMLIPQAAITEQQGKHYVAILSADNTAEPKEVKLGPVQGQMEVVLEGLQPTDKVVVGGIEKVLLRPGIKLAPQPYVAAPVATASPSPSASPAEPQATPAQ